MRIQCQRMVVCLLFFILSLPASAITKCVGADGSVSYVQGNCPDLRQERSSVKIWDSDSKNHNSGSTMVPGAGRPNASPSGSVSSKNQRQLINAGRASNLCNDPGRNPVEARMNRLGCEVLRQSRGSQSASCTRLASSNERMNPVEYRALMAQCRGSRN